MEKEREPQLYDTFSKNGVFYRVTSIEDGILTLKRSDGGKQGRPVTGTYDQLTKKKYRLCDIPQVTCYKLEDEEQEDEMKLESKTPKPAYGLVGQLTLNDVDAEFIRTLLDNGYAIWLDDSGYTGIVSVSIYDELEKDEEVEE